MNDKKNDAAWGKLFQKNKILERVLKDGSFIISAKSINEEREARLMTKFDHKSRLPKLFSNNNLAILPISRGNYIIGRFEAFYELEDDCQEILPLIPPSFLESLNFKDITSEATAINCAFVSNIFHDFTEENSLFPTVSGRMGSSKFDFNIQSLDGLKKIFVEDSQIEIDGGFEGDTSLILIEGKNYLPSDFLIRQLFYPYRLWTGKISKRVRSIFLTYSNGIFHLREFNFTDDGNYNSIVLTQSKRYSIQDEELNIETLQKILDTTKTSKEPEIPFPQADRFERVINLCELIRNNQFMTKDQYLFDFDFGSIDPRQHDYYTNAARYLGLVEKRIYPNTKQVCYVLSKIGNWIMSLPLAERQKEFIKAILSHSPFKKAMLSYLKTGKMPEKEEIIEIMKRSNVYNIGSKETYVRRASTVTGWINWIIDRIEI